MSDAVNCTKLDEQEPQVELLPARTVLSMFAQGLEGANGLDGFGALGGTIFGIPFGNGSSNGVGGAGGGANGGS
jgi:hypothetical protein